MAKGYFFVDARTCEDVLYVPRGFEVRCFDGREIKYSICFNKNKLEKYAIAGATHSEGIMWGVKNGLVEIIDFEDKHLKKICELCEAGDKGSIKQAEEIAMNVFDIASYGMDESIDEWDDDFDMPIDGT